MKEQELKKRISILEGHVVPRITRMQLSGGMQERLHRQELIRYGEDIKSKKVKFKDKLSNLKKDKKSKTKIRGKITELIAAESLASQSSQEPGDVFSVSAQIASEKRRELQGEFDSLSASIESPLDNFHEPMMRRVRSRRGFWG